jgi:multiple sugar transport system ATP-binding protein
VATVEFRNLIKCYGDLEVVHNINLSIRDGEFLVLVGPSGCGKSTSLRMLAGLEDITGGEILINDKIVNETEPRNRDIAMVFQDYALYPHMSVYDNMAFSLKYRAIPKSEIRDRVRETAEVLELTPLLDRKPKELSGGQRQRVAMGRAIVREPQVFLFDEPLSNLDAKLRGSMRLEMKRLHRRFSITTVYVTHDQIEAMTLADRVVVMNEGNIDQIGTPEEVYHKPETLFVASFIGSPTMNLLPARRHDDTNLSIGNGSLKIPIDNIQNDNTQDFVFGIRPENITLDELPANGANSKQDIVAEGVVEEVEPLGADTLVFAKALGESIVLRTRPDIRVEPGQLIRLRINPLQTHLFNAQTRKVIR